MTEPETEDARTYCLIVHSIATRKARRQRDDWRRRAILLLGLYVSVSVGKNWRRWETAVAWLAIVGVGIGLQLLANRADRKDDAKWTT